jgi:beta-aspartyl-peptidase (threonine type)
LFGSTHGSATRSRFTLWLLILAACRAGPRPDPRAEIVSMLTASAATWNRGQLDAFMNDYARDSVTYIARGHEGNGWQKLYDGYRAAFFAPGKHSDSLTFEEIRVHVLSPTLAYCTARFALHRGDSLTGSGPFTLVLEKRDGRWLILHDHTTADPKK